MTDKPQQIGDQPIDPKLYADMNELARKIDIYLNGTKITKRKNGFILMAFPFDGHDGRCNYISNADRDTMIVLLKEQLARFEGQPDIEGNA